MIDEQGGLNSDGGCAVDRSWLAGQRIRSVANGLDSLVVTFESGLTFKVQALLWQGKPFLSFDPHSAPAQSAG